MKNDEIYLFCIPTPNGVLNKQGYKVFSPNGIGTTLVANQGGLGKAGGLYLVQERHNHD